MQDLQTPQQPHLLRSSHNTRACSLYCASSGCCGRAEQCTVCRPAAKNGHGEARSTQATCSGRTDFERRDLYPSPRLPDSIRRCKSDIGMRIWTQQNQQGGWRGLPAMGDRDPASPDRPRSGPAALPLTPKGHGEQPFVSLVLNISLFNTSGSVTSNTLKGHCEHPFVSQSSCTGQQAMLSRDLMRTAQGQANTLRLPYTCKDQDYHRRPIIKIQL